MHGDATRWDARHARAPLAVPARPEGLAPVLGLLPGSGRALDVACGRGGQTVWAATQGFDVVALDVSPVAVRATTGLAEGHDVGHRVDVRVHDLDRGLPDGLGRFELVICQRFRAPDLVPALLDHVSAGGLVVLTVLSAVGAERPGRHHAPAGELLATVTASGAEILHHSEADGLATVVARPSPAHGPR